VADDADLAFELEQARLGGLLAGSRAPIEVGVAGECEECGEDMPRLVSGRCGYCRDGRRPPLSRFDEAPKPRPIVAAAVSTTEKPMTAVNTSDKQTISVPARGEVLAAIRAYADADDLPLGQAVIALVERAIAKNEPETTAMPADQALRECTLLELTVELHDRIRSGVTSTLHHQEAEERADAAEAKLAAVHAALAGVAAG